MTGLPSVGVADSGIEPSHAQVGPVAGGVGLRVIEGRVVTDGAWRDLLGHGTAVAATIRGHAPRAELYSIRIFRRRLLAPVGALLHAIDWAAEQGLDLLNLSLGCTDEAREDDFVQACLRARASGTVVVAAREPSARPWRPGGLDSVVSVAPDASLAPNELRYEGGVFRASSWARPLGALPRERNFHGASLAVAHVTGMAARLLEDRTLGPEELTEALRERATRSR